MEDKAKPRDLEERTFQFAQSIRAFVKELPKTIGNAEGVLSESETSLACFRWDDRFKFDPRWKGWPRGLRPLRCSFASLRMTL